MREEQRRQPGCAARELCRESLFRDTRYLLVGGYAIAVHAEPRFTKDLDVWVDPDGDNPSRVHEALDRFGAPMQQFALSDLQRPGMVIQLGVAPNRIDLVTSIDGVVFQDAWMSRAETTYGDHIVPVIGMTHLIENKRASGRPQDLADVDLLTKHRDS